MPETLVQSWEAWIIFLYWEVPLEEEMVTHSSILAWKIPWTEEREGLQFMASQCQTWLRRHASHMRKYWANFFMSPYTPDLKHNSSTRSKNFQTLSLSLTFFFFFTLTQTYMRPKQGLDCFQHKNGPRRMIYIQVCRVKISWSISSVLKLKWPASYQQSCLNKVTISKIAVVATSWSS